MADQLIFLIEKAVAKAGSYPKLAKQLGVGAQTAYGWSYGFKTPSDDKIAQLAQIAGEDEGKWVATMAAIKTGNTKAIEFVAKAWQHTLLMPFTRPKQRAKNRQFRLALT